MNTTQHTGPAPTRATQRVTTRAIMAAVCGLAIGSAGGLAQAQDGALSGPKVEDTAPPAVESTFTTSMESRRMGETLNLGQFMRAVRTLSGEDVAPELRLTAEQETALRNELRAHRQATAKYMEPFREEMVELQKKIGGNEQRQRVSDAPRARANDGAGRVQRDRRQRGRDAAEGRDGNEAREGRGGDRTRRQTGRAPRDAMDADRAGPRVSEKDREAATARLREIRRGGPQVADLQRRVWSHLTKPQQAFADKAVKKAMAEAEQERMDRMVQREVQKLEREGGTVNIDRLMARLPEEARARLEAMTPEQRDAAIKKIMERRDRGQGRATDGNNRRGGQTGRDRRQPPAMDDVELPDPD